MKHLQALLVLLVGVAAAIPGIAVTRQFDFPGGSKPLFEFVLTTFSAAVVLIAYVARHEIAKMRTWTAVGVAALLGIAIMVTFGMNVYLTNLVLVRHEYEGEGQVEHQFFPVFLEAADDSAVAAAGSRRAFIESAPDGNQPRGPQAVLRMTNERNTAMTLGLLLVSYTALIIAVVMLFAVIGFRAVHDAAGDDVQPPGGGANAQGAADRATAAVTPAA